MPTMPRTLKQPDETAAANRRSYSPTLPPEKAQALIAAAQDGDMEAFGQLYAVYRDTVFRFIYYRVSTRTLAEDLASETFVRALRRITTFSWQDRDFGAWLVTIGRNLIADHFKSSRIRMEISTSEMFDAEGDEMHPSPEDTLLDSLTNKTLMDAVEELTEQQRICITLRFLEELTVAETARVMGLSEGAVKTMQYRAVRTLGRTLTKADFDPDMALAA